MNKLGVVTAEEEIRILGFRKAEEVTGIRVGNRVGFVKIVVLVVFVVLVVIAMIIKNVR